MTQYHDERVDPFAEMTAVLRADTQAALASIAQTRALAAKLGLELTTSIETRQRKPLPGGRASKGKSKPNLAGWLRRATLDGTLPMPTETLIVKDRMVQQGLSSGYITGTRHPYRATPAGLAYAIENFKGRKVARR